MAISLRALISSSLLHKGSALIIGFLLWAELSPLRHATITATVPLCFYGDAAQHDGINAPETVTVTLRGPRADLARITPATLAVHLEAARLRSGKNGIIIRSRDLFLPARVRVVHYNPLPLVVIKHEKMC